MNAPVLPGRFMDRRPSVFLSLSRARMIPRRRRERPPAIEITPRHSGESRNDGNLPLQDARTRRGESNASHRGARLTLIPQSGQTFDTPPSAATQGEEGGGTAGACPEPVEGPLLRMRRSDGPRMTRKGIAPHRACSTTPYVGHICPTYIRLTTMTIDGGGHMGPPLRNPAFDTKDGHGGQDNPEEGLSLQNHRSRNRHFQQPLINRVSSSARCAFARIRRRRVFASTGYAGEAARRPSFSGRRRGCCSRESAGSRARRGRRISPHLR